MNQVAKTLVQSICRASGALVKIPSQVNDHRCNRSCLLNVLFLRVHVSCVVMVIFQNYYFNPLEYLIFNGIYMLYIFVVFGSIEVPRSVSRLLGVDNKDVAL